MSMEMNQTWNKFVWLDDDGRETSSITQHRSAEYTLKMAYHFAHKGKCNVRIYIDVPDLDNPQKCHNIRDINYHDIKRKPVLDYGDELANM